MIFFFQNVFERIAGELYEPEDLEEELEEVAFKRLTYSIGTFVYLQGDDDDVPPLIGLIHRAWRSTRFVFFVSLICNDFSAVARRS